MTTSGTIAIDWARDGNFSGAYDTVTARVIDAYWFLGMKANYQDTAHDSVLELTLDNTDRRYSPENASSPLYGQLAPEGSVVKTAGISDGFKAICGGSFVFEGPCVIFESQDQS